MLIIGIILLLFWYIIGFIAPALLAAWLLTLALPFSFSQAQQKRQAVSELKARVQQFLAAHTTLTLATVSADGRPQAASLFFAEAEDLSLVFISERKSRHSRNIARDSRVAATIYADGQQWQNIKGLQVEGECRALSGREAKEARTTYLAKYPFIEENKVLAAMLHLATFYRISPTWLRLIDNSRGFGHKEELALP